MFVSAIMSDITMVLQSIGREESAASEKLLPLVYAELRRLAAARMAHEAAGQTLQPTALVHEAWLRLVGTGTDVAKPRAFFRRGRRGDAPHFDRAGAPQVPAQTRRRSGARSNIEDFELAAATPDDKVLLVDEALARLEGRGSRTGADRRAEILRRIDQSGSGRDAGLQRAHAGPAMGLCQGLAVSVDSETAAPVRFFSDYGAATAH